VSEFETNLRWLSERGEPVGAEELIERIEADLAGDPLVVVAKRREGTIMTKNQQRPTDRKSNRYRGPAWGVAVFAAVLAVAGLYFAFSNDSGEVADNPPPPTTVAPDVETLTDLEIIEAGVAALYSGDADRAAELFELEASPSDDDPPLTDEQVRAVAVYQKAIGGRLTLNCTELQTPGEFSCRVPYHNALTDAIFFTDFGDTNRVVVKDGVITTFAFPEHSEMLVSMTSYLARELGGEVPEECRHWYSPFTENCVAIQLENLDGWAAFYKEEWPEHGDALTDQIVSIFESDVCQQGTIEECDRAHYRAITDWAADQE
jgi:hypothetical protein